jgi:effector-binding domain-containing protein
LLALRRIYRTNVLTLKWIEANGYRIVGPDREMNLYHTMPIRLDDPSYITEIQYPVEKAI